MSNLAFPARRALWVLAALCAAAIIAAIVMILLRPAPANLPAGSPQAAVQAYTAAYLTGDWETANEHSAQLGIRPCNEFGPDSSSGVDLLSVTERGDTATVHIRLTESYLGGPFSLGQSEHESSFELERQQGTWLITAAPWELSMCDDDELGY